jgi:hypothetical protein
MKSYRAVFFDWDGTAVKSRRAPVDEVVAPMAALLERGVVLAVISGTTYENIAGGELEKGFSTPGLGNLYLGLGRGAYNLGFEGGRPVVLDNNLPSQADQLRIHDICYLTHRYLLENYQLATDIVFSRPGYCKIDLLVGLDRGEQLFLTDGELATLEAHLAHHGFVGGLPRLVDLVRRLSEPSGLDLIVTSDAKYLEVGTTDKRHNVDGLLRRLQRERGIEPHQCCFWGDEFVGLGPGLYGSDASMITPLSAGSDFFDVSPTPGERPPQVTVLGGGVPQFLQFLTKLG